MSMQFANLAKSVAEDGHVSAEEILSLRRLGWGDGIMTREEAEAIFAINHQLTAPGNEWVDFFVEAIGEFVLNGTEPKGMCDEGEAQWLMAQLDADGKLETMAELEALVRVTERAQNVPDNLKHYTLKQIKQAVMTGEGPTRKGGELSASHVSTAECDLLRRLVAVPAPPRSAAMRRKCCSVLRMRHWAPPMRSNGPSCSSMAWQTICAASVLPMLSFRMSG